MVIITIRKVVRGADDRLRNELLRHCLIKDFYVYFIMTDLNLMGIMP